MKLGNNLGVALDFNRKEFFISTVEGDQYLVEVFEHHGAVCLSIGDKFRIDLGADCAFDIVDALTMVANDVDSHFGEE